MKIVRFIAVSSVLLAAANPFGSAHAASPLTNLWSFGLGNDGQNPQAALIQGSDSNFYGTTSAGGTHSAGTIFRITPAGLLTNLYNFGGTNDGGGPESGLVLGSDSNFYGTAFDGGTNDNGVVFKMTPAGTYTTLWRFTGGADGSEPSAGLIQGSDGNFYGTTQFGGTNTMGVVFQITSAGTLTPIYQFTGGSDGNQPNGLVQGSDSNFYGTTFSGGNSPSVGTVFKVTSAGTLTTLHNFSGAATDGANPSASMIKGNDNNFYGTTFGAGISGNGVVFKITSLGVYTNLYRFTGGADGANPQSPVIQGTDGNFYGTTSDGGTNGEGNVFKLTSAGTLTSLWQFGGTANDGDFPLAGLVQAGTNLFGTTYFGGSNDDGVVFEIGMPAGGGGGSNTLTQITFIQIVGANIIVTLPSQLGETYQLQVSALMNPTNWSPVAGAVVSGTGSPVTLTNVGGALLGPQHFYRVDISP